MASAVTRRHSTVGTMKAEPQNRATLEADTLRLYGTVGDDWDGFTDDTVADLLGAHDGPLTVRLNSPGGYVYQGMAIHTHLAQRDTTVIIDGLAASIASVIACAGRRVQIAAGAMMMIHNPWNIAMGDAEDLRKTADVLDKIKGSILDIYASKTGISRPRLAELMDQETWLTAAEAVELGLADEIIEAPSNLAGLNLGILPNLPAALSNRGTNMTTDNLSRREKAAAKHAQASAQAATIHAMVKASGFDADFANRLVEQGADAAAAQAAIRDLQDYMAKGKATEGMTNRHATCTGYGGSDDFPQAAADAIVKRATGKGNADPAVLAMSLVDIAEACVENSGARARSRKPADIVKAALTTSDFPSILEDALRKSLRAGMESESATHRDWVRISEASDLRDQKRPILSSAPDLDKVGEGNEYTYGSFDDDGTEFTVAKFGKIVRITWEALVNDDLDAFSRLAPSMGLTAIRKEADTVYNLLTQAGGAGATMQDGTALFHTDHSNIVTNATFDAAALAKARTALRRQKDISGKGWLNPTPRTLIVPPELEHDALNLVRQSTVHINSTAGTEAAPGWISDLVVIAEPRLELTNVAFLAAAYSQVDHVELATLAGSPEIKQRDGWEIDDLEWKIRHVFGAGALDWRGLVRLTITG